MIKLSKVVKISKVSKYAFKIEFQNEDIAKKALVGQFVHIKLAEEFVLRRPISISDVNDDIISIIFEVRGNGTLWLSKIKSGIELDVLGPLGIGFDLKKSGENPLFIGGGIGVPPLLLSAKNAKNPTIIAGFRNVDFVMLEDEFRNLSNDVTITTDDGTYGVHGFVTDVLAEKIKSATSVYACGPSQMLKSIVEMCEENDVFCEISLEERMACGVGACLVCACKVKSEDNVEKFAHVCADGPVFNAKEVIF